MTVAHESLLAELAAARMAANRARHCADRTVERLDRALAAAYEAGVQEAERVLDLLFGHGWVVERPAEVTSEGEGRHG